MPGSHEIRVGVNRPPVDAELEVGVWGSSLGVARVADESDQLAGFDSLADRQPRSERRGGSATAIIPSPIVVEVEIPRSPAVVVLDHDVVPGVRAGSHSHDDPVEYCNDRIPLLPHQIVAHVDATVGTLVAPVILEDRVELGLGEHHLLDGSVGNRQIRRGLRGSGSCQDHQDDHDQTEDAYPHLRQLSVGSGCDFRCVWNRSQNRSA